MRRSKRAAVLERSNLAYGEKAMHGPQQVLLRSSITCVLMQCRTMQYRRRDSKIWPA